jgi:LysR family transcriptional regulator, regulator of abg operon
MQYSMRCHLSVRCNGYSAHNQELYMRLNQIRDFVALVEGGSMSAAARSVGVSQPSITKSVRALENELHVQLVQRTTRGIVPTRYGQLFFARAKVARSELGKAVAELGQLAGLQAGSVAFGCGPIVADLIVPDAIVAFRSQFPQADVRMVEGFAHTLVPKVRDETLDFAVSPRLPEFRPGGNIHFRPLFVHERVIAGRRGHPLARAKSLAELAKAAWLTFEPRELLERDFVSYGLPMPRPVVQCESYIGFLRLLETTDMLGTVPRSTRLLSGDPLRVFEIPEKLPTLTVGMFTRADSPLTPAAAALAKAVVASSRKLAKRS